jgi:hypothetical protein
MAGLAVVFMAMLVNVGWRHRRLGLKPVLKVAGLGTVLGGGIVYAATLPVLAYTPLPRPGGIVGPKSGLAPRGVIMIAVDSTDYAFEQTVDRETMQWKSPKWTRDNRSLLGMCGIMPPHGWYRGFAWLGIVVGLGLVLQPWRWLLPRAINR